MVSSKSTVNKAFNEKERGMGAKVVGPRDGRYGQLGTIGVRFMVDSAESGGGFSLVEHPIPPRGLAAPMHRHSREDEYSFVLEGRMGALLGEEEVCGEPGDLIFKPRNQWHTFWNAGDEPARILEIISPGGFEGYFAELIDLLAGGGPPDGAQRMAIAAAYGLEVDPGTIPHLLETYGLVFGAAPASPASSA
jgi:quercetin dioxygenase-like cupin family protein